jgi:hypothetical protein
MIGRHVELANAAGNVRALLDAHQPFVFAQLLADFAGHLKETRRRAVYFPQNIVERFLRYIRIVAQRLERLLLPLELLEKV